MGSDGRLYAIGGGTDAANAVTTVEAYTTNTNSWSTVASLNTARRYPSAALGFDGRIYVFGGLAADGVTVLNTVECYSAFSTKWTLVASMPTARWISAAAVGSSGRLFVMGGVNAGGTALATVEAYNPNSSTWTTVVSMPAARFGLGAALAFDGNIYAFGGAGGGGVAFATTFALSGVGGFGAAATKSAPAASGELTASSVLTATVTISPLSETASQNVVPSGTASDNTAQRDGTDAVFVLGADSLSDALFVGSIG